MPPSTSVSFSLPTSAMFLLPGGRWPGPPGCGSAAGSGPSSGFQPVAGSGTTALLAPDRPRATVSPAASTRNRVRMEAPLFRAPSRGAWVERDLRRPQARVNEHDDPGARPSDCARQSSARPSQPRSRRSSSTAIATATLDLPVTRATDSTLRRSTEGAAKSRPFAGAEQSERDSWAALTQMSLARPRAARPGR